jgi:hypothetical protein
MARLIDMGKIVVYDTVDPWRQPDDGLACDGLDQVRDFFARYFADLPAHGVIFANRAMCEDLGRYVWNPTYIYHHYRPGLLPAGVRRDARVVGYHGVPEYLGAWKPAIQAACGALGLEFRTLVSAPFDDDAFRAFDIGVVARGGPHGSLMACRYKSNVKLANLLGAGIPCVASYDEQACRETSGGGVRFFGCPEDLRNALGELRSSAVRRGLHESYLEARERFSLDAISDEYERYFTALITSAGRFDRTDAPESRSIPCGAGCAGRG